MNNIERCIKELGWAAVPTEGTSMLPLLREGKTLVDLVGAGREQLKKGDVVLFRKNDGTLVLHRIISIDRDGVFTVLGDHQFKSAEQIQKEQIVAVARGFFIGGRYVDDKTRWYRIYKKIWLSNLNVRRFCLALFDLKRK